MTDEQFQLWAKEWINRTLLDMLESNPDLTANQAASVVVSMTVHILSKFDLPPGAAKDILNGAVDAHLETLPEAWSYGGN